MAVATSSITSGTTASGGALNLTAGAGASDIALEVVNANTKYTVDAASVFNSHASGNRWGPVVSVDAAFLDIQAGAAINSITQNATGISVTNGGTLSVTGGLTLNVASKDASGIIVNGGNASLGNDVSITVSNTNTLANTGAGVAIIADNGSVVTIGDGFKVDRPFTGGPYGMLQAIGGSTLTIGNDAEITTGKQAITVAGTSSLTFGNNLQLTHTGGEQAISIESSGTLDLGANATINSTGLRVFAYAGGGAVTGVNTHIIHSGTGHVVRFADGGNAALLHLENPTIESTTAAGIFTVVGGGTITKTVEIIGGTINAPDSPLVNTSTNAGGSRNTTDITISGGAKLITNGLLNDSVTTGGTITLTLDDVDASEAGGITVGAGAQGATAVTVNGGSGIHGDVTNSGSGTLNLGLNDSSVTGNINNNNGTVSSTGTSAINGNVNGSLEVSSGTLTVTGSVTVDNGQSVTGNGTLNVGGLEINDGGTLGGGLTIGTDSATRILIGLSSATLYHEFGSLTEIGADTLKLGDNIALDLSGIDGLSGFTFAFTDEVQNGDFTLILGKAESLENWNEEINGSISGLTLSGQNEVTADITITLNGEGSALTATLSNVSVNAVPEPSTYFLIGTGLGLLLLTARCRRQAKADA